MGDMVNVTNRNNGFTGYVIPDTGVTKTFMPGETKKIDIEELKQLQYVEGGDYLLKHFFIIDNKAALEVLNMENVEPEYFYTEAEVKELLENGSLAQLEDALNFSPEGVLEIIKTTAVKTKLPDTRKRKLISEKTGFNIDNAIMLEEVMSAEETATEQPETKVRKAAPITARKAEPVTSQTSKYKVVSK